MTNSASTWWWFGRLSAPAGPGASAQSTPIASTTPSRLGDLASVTPSCLGGNEPAGARYPGARREGGESTLPGMARPFLVAALGLTLVVSASASSGASARVGASRLQVVAA